MKYFAWWILWIVVKYDNFYGIIEEYTGDIGTGSAPDSDSDPDGFNFPNIIIIMDDNGCSDPDGSNLSNIIIIKDDNGCGDPDGSNLSNIIIIMDGNGRVCLFHCDTWCRMKELMKNGIQ